MENEKRRKAGSAYLMCFSDNCPRHAGCLHWMAGCDAGEDQVLVNSINPRCRSVADGTCNRYRDASPVTMPLGMSRFYDDMPKKIASAIRPKLEELCLHKNYYLYQRGDLPIPPHVEERIKEICRECGWDGPLTYDGYVTERLW